jgi:gliding motility-associated-like protein
MRPNPLANFTVYPRETSLSNALIHMNNFTLNAENCLWSFGDNSMINTDCNPNHQYLEEGTYEIQLLVENEFGCTDSMIQKVVIHPKFDLFIPNAFTPDKDDVNDTFIYKGFGIELFRISIFNRWGDLIFFSDEFDNFWDGTYESGETCMNGVYTYKIVVQDLLGKEYVFIGEISLIR